MLKYTWKQLASYFKHFQLNIKIIFWLKKSVQLDKKEIKLRKLRFIMHKDGMCDMFSQIERQTEGHRKVADTRTKKRT